MSEYLDLNRRDLLRHILVLSGAAATANISLTALAEVAQSSDQFLDKEAYTLLSSVADTIVPVTDTPGALAADVPANLDALLINWAAPQTRDILVAALGRIDVSAQSATGKNFATLLPQERNEFLAAHDQAALQPAPPPEDAPKGGIALMRQQFVVDNGYQRLKGLIISLYYVSEIGMTQELVYEHVPGEWVPSLKVTPGMRRFASPGFM